MVLGSKPALLGASVSRSGFIIISSVNHEIDVVPGERQSFVVIVFQALSRIPCPSVHSANTNSVLMMTWSQSWDKKMKHRKMVIRTKHKHNVLTQSDTIVHEK